MFSLPVLIARGLDLQLCRQPCFFLPFLFSFEGVIPQIVGVFNGEGPPVPIPNTEVKLTSADNTCLETDREDRSMPTQKTATLVAVFLHIYDFAYRAKVSPTLTGNVVLR